MAGLAGGALARAVSLGGRLGMIGVGNAATTADGSRRRAGATDGLRPADLTAGRDAADDAADDAGGGDVTGGAFSEAPRD